MLFLLTNNGFKNSSLPTSLTYGLGRSSSPVRRDAEGLLKHGVLVWGWFSPRSHKAYVHCRTSLLASVCSCVKIYLRIPECRNPYTRSHVA